MSGQGAKIRSSWALEGYGIHLPRKALNFGDTDELEKVAWQDWFFEAIIPPEPVFVVRPDDGWLRALRRRRG